MLIAETHLGLVVGRGRLDDDGGLGRLGADLRLGAEGLAGESGGGEGSHLVGKKVEGVLLGAGMVSERKWFGLRTLQLRLLRISRLYSRAPIGQTRSTVI